MNVVVALTLLLVLVALMARWVAAPPESPLTIHFGSSCHLLHTQQLSLLPKQRA